MEGVGRAGLAVAQHHVFWDVLCQDGLFPALRRRESAL